MATIIGVILYAVFCYWILNAVYNKVVEAQSEHNATPVVEEKKCPPHRWRRKKQPGNEEGYLQCTHCNVFPGYTDDRS